jgi:hypothetical protein
MTRETITNLLKEALEYAGGTHTVEDAWKMIDEGRAELWVFGQSVMVTQMIKTPRKMELQVWLAAGALPDMEVLEKQITEFANVAQCDRMVFSGRKGWERSFLVERGWKPTLVTLEKELHHG